MAKKKNQCDEVKRCIICNKPIENEDDMFGGGCLDNLYELLDIPVPKRISNKEKYLLDAIAHKNSKYFLSREKKIAIAKNYIAWSYLNKINLNFTKDEKSKLEDNIKNISPFKSLQSSYIPEYLLNDFYKVYNYYMRFEEKINNYTTKSDDNSGKKEENGNWDLTVEIIDKYDYTDLKMPKEYTKSFGSKSKSLLASTLNNYAAVSSSYGVIRPFNFIIKVKNNNYNTENN